MRPSGYWLRRQIAGCLVMCLTVPVAEAAAAPPQQPPVGQQVQSGPSAVGQPEGSDSQTTKLGTDTSRGDNTYPDNPNPAPAQAPAQIGPTADQSGQSSRSQSSSQQQQNDNQKPVGTAAAPYERTTGIAASRPAGAVIAPAKQRRARSIFIRVSIVVGAAVAVGTVVALSNASPSRPH
jgi:hypothetical protein